MWVPVLACPAAWGGNATGGVTVPCSFSMPLSPFHTFALASTGTAGQASSGTRAGENQVKGLRQHELHRDELWEDWLLAEQHQPLNKITPLE